MSSYKPVVYIFSAIGLLAIVGITATAIQGFRKLSEIDTRYSADDFGAYNDLDSQGVRLNIGRSDSIDWFMNSTQTNLGTSTQPTDGALAPNGDSYLGTGVLYATMEDSSVMKELKLRDDIDPAFKALLTRADSSFQELYQSDTKLALKMLANDEKTETILVQDLRTGDIIDTKINAHANFKFIGPQIVYFVAGKDAAARPDELVQAMVYNIETNQTKNEAALATGQSFTKVIDTNARPVTDMKITNGKVEVHIYSSKDPARFDRERPSMRTISYPSGR